jgi:hypothetical protein
MEKSRQMDSGVYSSFNSNKLQDLKSITQSKVQSSFDANGKNSQFSKQFTGNKSKKSHFDDAIYDNDAYFNSFDSNNSKLIEDQIQK